MPREEQRQGGERSLRRNAPRSGVGSHASPSLMRRWWPSSPGIPGFSDPSGEYALLLKLASLGFLSSAMIMLTYTCHGAAETPGPSRCPARPPGSPGPL